MPPLAIDPLSLTELAAIGRALPAWKVAVARTLFRSFLLGSTRAEWLIDMADYFEKGESPQQAFLHDYNNISDDGRSPIRIWTPFTTPLMVGLAYWAYQADILNMKWWDILSPWVSDNEEPVLLAAKKAEKTYQVFLDLADQAEDLSRAVIELVGKVGQIYIMILGTVVGMWLMSIDFFPQFLALMKGQKMPPSIQTLKDFSDFFGDFGPYLIGMILALPFLVVRSWPRTTGKLRQALDLIPLYNIYRTWTSLAWLQSSAYLFAGGGNVADAVEIQLPRATPYMRERLEAIARHDDMRLGDALEQMDLNWPPKAVIRRVKKHVTEDEPGKNFLRFVKKDRKKTMQRLGVTINLIQNATNLGMGLFLAWLIFTAGKLAMFTH